MKCPKCHSSLKRDVVKTSTKGEIPNIFACSSCRENLVAKQTRMWAYSLASWALLPLVIVLNQRDIPEWKVLVPLLVVCFFIFIATIVYSRKGLMITIYKGKPFKGLSQQGKMLCPKCEQRFDQSNLVTKTRKKMPSYGKFILSNFAHHCPHCDQHLAFSPISILIMAAGPVILILCILIQFFIEFSFLERIFVLAFGVLSFIVSLLKMKNANMKAIN